MNPSHRIDTSCPVASVFARRVRSGAEPDYERWLSGIIEASSGFTGNLGTTVLSPAEGRDDYVAITHFDSGVHLQGWLDSAERRDWLSRLGDIPIESEFVDSHSGMEHWFRLPGQPALAPPPRYKTAALVILGLYPLLLALGFVLNPILGGLPHPLRTLISMVISVGLMIWFVSPALTRAFGGWLHPKT